jgi:hypothetical protein
MTPGPSAGQVISYLEKLELGLYSQGEMWHTAHSFKRNGKSETNEM